MRKTAILAILAGLFLAAPASFAAGETGAAPLSMVPKPPGKSSTCAAFYPTGPLASDARGVTDLSIHIPATGEVEQARVLQSSGNAEFDVAAIACADNYFIQPANKDGKHIGIEWLGRIDWRRPAGNTILSVPLQNEGQRFCLNFPDTARRAGEEGNALVTFDIAADGVPHDLNITRSTGYSDLDDAALACVARYRYFPATQGGVPIEFEWRSGQGFTLR